MDPDTEVESILRHENVEEEEDDEEERKKRQRPPSSYGSMKSDSDEMGDEDDDEEEECEDEVAEEACPSPLPMLPPESTVHEETGLEMTRSESPETLITMTTEQTKPPGAMVIDTRSSDLESPDEDEEYMDEDLVTHSPEPPEPVEPEDTTQADEDSQPGRLHPEQDLPHIFKSIQSVLSRLSREDLLKFKMWYHQWEKAITLQQVMDGDLLDFVDRTLEVLGQERSLSHTLSTLEHIGKLQEAEELRGLCRRALIRFYLKKDLIRRHHVIREGVVRAGRQNMLKTIYVEPIISTRGYGGIDPSHPIRREPLPPVQIPTDDTFVHLNDLFRLRTADGQPVRTVVTTGIAGIGMGVSVGKFSLDWAELRANKDLQFIIKLSFRSFWYLRTRNPLPSKKPVMSITEVIEYYYRECKDFKYLEEEGCKFLIIMDALDCYQAPLDWENAPVINDNHTEAHPDVLIVNIIRGTVLRGARVWILGRRAAVSQIPSRFIDVVTEIQGFNDEMKDEYLTRRFNADKASQIIAHYKRLPMLHALACQPFVCWMVATVFERCFRYQGYGQHPPRLTPFYVSILIVHINRRLQFYYGRNENELKWGDEDKILVTKLGKMALKMLEKNRCMFYEEDLEPYGLNLTEVVMLSGLCTELPAASSDGKRAYCFIHYTVQEFIAAVYVFTLFRLESKNVLETRSLHMPKLFNSKDKTRSAADLIQCALEKTLSAPLGQYDMFLRFLCGLLSPDCHHNQLSGCLFSRNSPKVSGLEDVKRLLERAIQTAQQNNRERVENLKECLREMSQNDE